MSSEDKPVVNVQKQEDIEADEHHINYQSMSWWHCGLIMLAETVSLGILSLPMAVSGLGLVAGVMLILVMGALATYSAYMIGQFIKKYPQARDFSQAGAILFGKHARWGREIFGVVMIIVLLMIMAAHVVAFQIMMITLVDKYVCSIVWAFIGAFVQYIGTIPRTMKNTSLLSALSSISVLIAVFMVMVDTGVNDRDPDGTKRQHPGAFDRRPNVSESSTVTGIMNIVLSYAGHVAYFSFAHELRKPTDYNKAVFAQLGTATFLYALVGGVTYYNVGYTVAGLSLSSASPLVSKAAYGVASLTIVMAGVVNAHVAAKYFYNRYFQELSRDKTFKARFVWHCIIGGLWLIAFLLAILIPSFQHMLSLVSSLITGFITYGLPGVLYYKYVLKGSRWSSRRAIGASTAAVMFVIFGLILTGGGLAAWGMEVKQGLTGKAASCQANRPTST